MIRRRAATRTQIACVLALACIALCCGGGGSGGGPVDQGPEFTADDPSPGNQTLSLQPGGVSGSSFDVRVRVTGIQDFFGAGFRVTFDPTVAELDSFSQTGSVLLGAGVDTRFDVFEIGPGVIDVVATREGSDLAGVDVGATSTLVTLTFTALDETVAPEPFAITAPRQVQVCPQAGQACSTLADGTVTWSGGSLVVS